MATPSQRIPKESITSSYAEASASQQRNDDDNHNSIYYLIVHICGLEVRALVDTWAELTHINQTMADYLRNSDLIDEAKSATVQTVNQRIVECMELCELDVSYNNRTSRISALVMPFLSEQLILGMDFLRQRQCQLRIDIKPMIAEESSEVGANIRSPSTSPSCHTADFKGRPEQYTEDYLFGGIVIRRPKIYQRRLQFVMHREDRPLVQVTVLNKSRARLRCMGQEKIVEMQ